MQKKLIRDNEEVEGTTSTVPKSEKNKVLLETISSKALEIASLTNAEDVLGNSADIIELLKTYLVHGNYDPNVLFKVLYDLHNSKGSYSKMRVEESAPEGKE